MSQSITGKDWVAVFQVNVTIRVHVVYASCTYHFCTTGISFVSAFSLRTGQRTVADGLVGSGSELLAFLLYGMWYIWPVVRFPMFVIELSL